MAALFFVLDVHRFPRKKYRRCVKDHASQDDEPFPDREPQPRRRKSGIDHGLVLRLTLARSMPHLCLSEIKSGYIRDAIRRGLDGKEYALPSLRCATGAHPCPRPSACASHYSSERKM
jgi:hypothetical protein